MEQKSPVAQVLPVLNLHLTKSRLNDAPRFCEMHRWGFQIRTASRGRHWNGPGPDWMKSRVALKGRSRKKPSRKSVLIRRLSGAAVACLIAGCGFVVYNNIFAANVYPTLGDTGYDAPVVHLPAQAIPPPNTSTTIHPPFPA